MDIIAEIRRRHFIEKETITSLAEAFKLSRPTIRKHLKTVEEPVYQRQNQPYPKLGSFHEQLEAWLEQEAHLPRKQRRSDTNVSRWRVIEAPIRLYNAM